MKMQAKMPTFFNTMPFINIYVHLMAMIKSLSLALWQNRNDIDCDPMKAIFFFKIFGRRGLV